MNIWFDITNSPHVVFFEELINNLRKEHKIIITCRDLANTLDLLNLKGFKYHQIGGHAGGNILKKLLYFPKRVASLRKFLKDKDIDISISHSSFYSPITSWLLRKPSIYLNDNEHAKGNWISFLFATKTLIPEFLGKIAKKQKWTWLTKIILYPGTKECVYLKNFEVKKNKHSESPIIYFRPEPWTAQYYSGKRFFTDNLLIELSKEYEIHLLPRGELQASHFKTTKFPSIIIEDKAIELEQIINSCDIFIGAGGTMTREIAIMGIPTISIYQDNLLEVDKYLISNNFMKHNQDLEIDYIHQFIKKRNDSSNHELLNKGQKAYNLIKNIIFETIKNE